jgi:hypothetical protein
MQSYDTTALPDVDAPTLQTSAMVLRLHISMYTGRKSDKKTQQEVVADKGATNKQAASVYKSLFAGDQDLDAINALQARARREIAAVTLPWSDSGERLVSTRNFFEVSGALSSLRADFDQAVALFVRNYAVKVGNAAFALGDLFDRTEYPDPNDITHKFSFNYSFEPVPTHNDFRVDLSNETVEVLKSHYQKAANDRLSAAVQDVWERVITETTRLHDKLIVPESGARPRIHATTLDGFKGLIDSLEALNITNDTNLETTRVNLKNTLDAVDIDSLRESDSVRNAVREQMQSVLDRFN